MFTLLIRGSMLPGAIKGVKFFITPDWGKLLDPAVSSNNNIFNDEDIVNTKQ